MKRHLLICGERGVGKSTLIRRLLEHKMLISCWSIARGRSAAL